MSRAIIVVFLLVLISVTGCKPKQSNIKSSSEELSFIQTNEKGNGQTISLQMVAGPEHNHPLMAVWVEDLDGNYIQPLFVAKSIATGIFAHAEEEKGKWKEGEQRRPAALPRWAHQRGVKATDGLFVPDPQTAVADAYTGATPPSSFKLSAKLDEKVVEPIMIMVEINQSWDWNEHWTNSKYPNDEEYMTSSQPALIFGVKLDPVEKGVMHNLKLIGRSHYSGKDGKIYTDHETITTAKQIFTFLEAGFE